MEIYSNKPFWQLPESRRLEFKQEFPPGTKIAETAIAFANSAGGKIIFGVQDDPREIIGVPDSELFNLELKIVNHLHDLVFPTLVPEIYIQTIKSRSLLIIEIYPGSDKPYYLKKLGKENGTFVRIGSTNRKASKELLDELERQRMKISYDSIVRYDTTAAEIDLESFKDDYKRITGKLLDRERLINIGLFKKDRDQIYPTNAAVLLSDSPIRKHEFPYAKIECARFKGADKRVFLDQQTIEKPIHKLAESCLDFVKKNIALSSEIGEIYRQDRWEYPLEAIREAIINAIIHRDYSILGSDIKLAIFDDRLEIISPGPLPETITLENLGSGRSEIRNRVLAPIFKDLRLIEAWGTGIQKIKHEINEAYPEIELVFDEIGYGFLLKFIKKFNPYRYSDKIADVIEKWRK
jgi:ATP-dependent DNA helicase RecG